MDLRGATVQPAKCILLSFLNLANKTEEISPGDLCLVQNRKEAKRHGWQPTAVSQACEMLIGNSCYYATSPEGIFPVLYGGRKHSWNHFFLNHLAADQMQSIHQSASRELLVGHWYAKLNFNRLQMFQGHLDCNSENPGVEEEWRTSEWESMGLIHEKDTDHLHRRGMHEKSVTACLCDLWSPFSCASD